ncbi:hypothetical protein M3Y95_00839200 [Aphelenchoides besseyi]|nr:hypothetical protein M3Y95_00839200 [Aphelenchoides besseyi]
MNNKLAARAVLLEQFEDEINVQKAIGRVISELGPEVIDEKKAVEWYAKFTAGDTDISEGSRPSDQFLLRNGTFLKWNRAIVSEFDFLKCLSRSNEIDNRFFPLIDRRFHRIFLVDTLHGIKKYVKVDCSNFTHAEIRRMLLRPIQFLNDNQVFGSISLNGSNEVTLFRGTLDSTTCTLNFNKMLQFELAFQWLSKWYTVEDKTKDQLLIVFLPFPSGPTQILTVNIKNDELTIVNKIEGPARLINATLRGDKLFGFEGRDTKNLIEFSLTDQTTRIHKIQNAEQFENIGYIADAQVWIGDLLFLGRGVGNTELTSIFVFDLVGLEWKKTKYEVRGWILEMSTNDGNQLNVHRH